MILMALGAIMCMVFWNYKDWNQPWKAIGFTGFWLGAIVATFGLIFLVLFLMFGGE